MRYLLFQSDPWYSSTYFTPDVPFYQRGSEQPQVAGGIKPGETLDIGHGNSGVDPFKFVISDELLEDRTYFKIILTTSPADFSMLSQTYNPVEAPSVLDASMVKSNTARTGEETYDRSEAIRYVKSQQGVKREDMYYYSVNLTIRQCPK